MAIAQQAFLKDDGRVLCGWRGAHPTRRGARAIPCGRLIGRRYLIRDLRYPLAKDEEAPRVAVLRLPVYYDFVQASNLWQPVRHAIDAWRRGHTPDVRSSPRKQMAERLQTPDVLGIPTYTWPIVYPTYLRVLECGHTVLLSADELQLHTDPPDPRSTQFPSMVELP
jgi:hypothetical protein